MPQLGRLRRALRTWNSRSEQFAGSYEAVPLDMSKTYPDRSKADASNRLIAADLFLLQEPDDEEDEEEDDDDAGGEENDDDEGDTDDGYSE